MSEITLEKVDAVIERTYVGYAEAKKALEECNGNVLDAIIYIEQKSDNKANEGCKKNETIEEFKNWLKGLIEKGDITRIKIRKDEKELIDVPVNAGIAATVIAVIIPPILAFGVIAAVATKITIEVTKADGSVEVINKYISKAADEVKDKTNTAVDFIKDKLKKSSPKDSEKVYTGHDTVYSYTVKFDEEDGKDL